MYKTSKKLTIINIAHEFESENYEKIIDCAEKTQTELIHNWQVKNKDELKYLILASSNILNFWFDSIVKINCGLHL